MMVSKRTKSSVTVNILVEGYYYTRYKDGKSEYVCPTVALVQDNGLRIISDPGTVQQPFILVDRLKMRDLKPVDIDVVFISHSHMDHFKYVGLFPQAKVFDYWGVWQDDGFRIGEKIINENIQLIETPGHTYDSVSLMVKADIGTVVICGDVFWNNDLFFKDPFLVDPELLKKSRDLVLDVADYIVPGHGPMFKT